MQCDMIQVMKRLSVVVLLSIYSGLLCAQTAPPPDVWQPVRFLLGTWKGDVSGQPGNGASERDYRFVLNGRFLEVRNTSAYLPQPANPKGEIHEDWGMISYDRSRKVHVLRQFHIEGFVNQYVSAPPHDGVLRFISESIENIQPGNRARETYTVLGPDEFIERFEIAEPGKDFEVYSETRFHRKK